MPEENVVTPPASADTGAGNPPKTNEPAAQSLPIEDVHAIKNRLATLEKQIKDKDEFIGRQTNEIGDLRKKLNVIIEPNSLDNVEGKDPEIIELAKMYQNKGMSKDDALYNAEIIVESNRRLESKKIVSEVQDHLEDAFEEGRIDRGVYQENLDAIREEFSKRKPAATAKGNFKLLRECYQIVVKRKAGELQEKGKIESESQRDKQIASVSQPQGGAKTPPAETGKEYTDKILKYGPQKKSSVFF